MASRCALDGRLDSDDLARFVIEVFVIGFLLLVEDEGRGNNLDENHQNCNFLNIRKCEKNVKPSGAKFAG